MNKTCGNLRESFVDEFQAKPRTHSLCIQGGEKILQAYRDDVTYTQNLPCTAHLPNAREVKKTLETFTRH